LFFTTSLALAVLNSHKGAVYDLMSTPSTDQEAPGIPAGSDEKAADSLPTVPPVPAAPNAEKAVEQVQPTAPAGNSAEIKETVVPKAEDIKTVEDKSKKQEKTK
jgi:hypothetical protein